ncbi:uncharacterized protein [Palaemon carinicauda]|uniref:uncharacterized protein n=1 Tax=Palaemon carinicauda TaxID=392227 RepID=UPI0035B650F7
MVNDNEDMAKIGLAALESLKGLAERWACIDTRLALSSQFPYSEFRLEKVQKLPKAVNILKEDRQAFGLLVGKAASPEEVHSHPLTSLPLALATPDRDLRQTSKSSLRNYLMEESSSIEYTPPDQSIWLVDGMAAVRTLPPQQTWRKYGEELLKFCLPPSSSKPLEVGIIFDSYGTATTKELTQIRRAGGTPGRRVHIKNADQSIPTGKDWNSFLTIGENKSELIKFLASYFKSSKLEIPLIVTHESETFRITASGTEILPNCNHHEADTRIVYHASIAKDPVVIRATDTDILVLLCYAYSVCNPEDNWMMKVDDRYVSVRKVVEHFGDDVCKVLPAYHSITGCDTTSFPYGVGKIKPLKKMRQKGKVHLLAELGTSVHSVQKMEGPRSFMQTCMYSGTDKETFVETRIRMFNKKQVKSSVGILPDGSSADEHIKRSVLQALIW